MDAKKWLKAKTIAKQEGNMRNGCGKIAENLVITFMV